MKVYASPVPFAEPDYQNYDSNREQAREQEHQAQLKQHLIDAGYKGKHTGEIVRFPMADGAAQYMLADGSGQYGGSFLVHLPYGDAWNSPHAKHYSKNAIVEKIEQGKKLASLFGKKEPMKLGGAAA